MSPKLPNSGFADTLDALDNGPSLGAPGSAESQAIKGQLTGTVIGDKYEVLELIGQGGIGSVYRARHLQLDSLVAIKVLWKTGNPAYKDMFLQEARMASQVRHPNIVYLSDCGVLPDGSPYLVMELLSGSTLSKALREQRFSVQRACQIALQISRGLQSVHDKGIIHRDMKPDNIFLLEQEGGADLVKIVDFGIARRADDAAAPWGEGGMISGTPTYMSPEQAQSLALDYRTDQYSLGCILYEMLTGTPPFRHNDLLEVLRMHIEDLPVPLRQRCPELDISDGLNELVLRLLAKSSQARFPQMRDVEAWLLADYEKRFMAQHSASSLPPVIESPPPAGKESLALIVRGRKIPLLLLAPLAVLMFLAVIYEAFRFWSSRSANAQQQLRPGEMLELRQRALAELVAELQTSNKDFRRDAIIALGRSHEVALYPKLKPALADADPEMQADAAEALGSLGEPKALPELSATLTQSNVAGVRIAAARALRQLGDERANEALGQMLLSSVAELRQRAALILCEQVEDPACKVLQETLARGALPDLMQMDMLARLSQAGDPVARQRLLGRARGDRAMAWRLVAASRLAQIGDQAGRELLRETARRPGPDQLLAARLLASPEEEAQADLFRRVLAEPRATLAALRLSCEGLGETARSFDARLLGTKLSTQTAEEIRIASAAAILRISENEPSIASTQTLAWARSALGDRRWQVRQSAVAVLGDLREQDALPLLRAMLMDAEPQVRRSVVHALGRRTEYDALSTLRAGIKDADAGVRTETLKALNHLIESQRAVLGKSLDEIVGWLSDLPASATTYEQLLAAHILLQLGDHAKVNVIKRWRNTQDPELRSLVVELTDEAGELAAALSDPNFKVRFAAARKLGANGDPRALTVLREALTTGGPESVIATGLLRQLDPQAVAGIDLAKALRSESVEKRMAAIEALGTLRPEVALPLLEQAALDREPLVRRLVAEVAADLPVSLDAPHPADALLRRLGLDADPGVRARAFALLDRSHAVHARVSEHAPQPSRPLSAAPAVATATPASPPSADSLPAPTSQPGIGLLLNAPAGIWIQIDKRPWQLTDASPQPIALAPGSHQIGTLDGLQDVAVPASGTLSLALQPSNIEQLMRNGLEFLSRKQYSKALPPLERASAQCARLRYKAPICAEIAFDATFCSAEAHEVRRELPEAMTVYEKALALGAGLKGRAAERAKVSSAVERLSSQLGKVIITRQQKNGCTSVPLWKSPGTYIILDAYNKSHQVRVRAGETSKVGDC